MAKIFWNKDLVLGSKTVMASLAEIGLGRVSRIPPSLRVPKFPVKVVRHKIGKSFCGRLWKKVSGRRERSQ
jgi:hypothetical protein